MSTDNLVSEKSAGNCSSTKVGLMWCTVILINFISL